MLVNCLIYQGSRLLQGKECCLFIFFPPNISFNTWHSVSDHSMNDSGLQIHENNALIKKLLKLFFFLKENFILGPLFNFKPDNPHHKGINIFVSFASNHTLSVLDTLFHSLFCDFSSQCYIVPFCK